MKKDNRFNRFEAMQRIIFLKSFIILNNFNHATINVFVNNTTDIKRDEELVAWFIEKYKFIDENTDFEVLYNNTDFGVGD